MRRRLIKKIIQGIEETGAMICFGMDALKIGLKGGVNIFQVVEQMYTVGVRSLPTTVVAGLFVGAIMAIQIEAQLKDFGAVGFLGGLTTSVTIRNIGPCLIAFMLSGKVGAYTSAELGTMRVTDQIDAIRCLGTNPIQYIIVPRMIAVIISSFLLLIIGLMVSIAGGILISDLTLGVSPMNYLLNISRIVSWSSFMLGIFKSFVFGILIAIVSCYKGYNTTGGAVGVGNSVRSTAVITLVCIIVADFSLSLLVSFILNLFGGA